MTSSNYPTDPGTAQYPVEKGVPVTTVAEGEAELLYRRVNALQDRYNTLMALSIGTLVAVLGLLGWSVYQSIQQSKIAERQAAIISATSDSVDFARLQSLDENLQQLEQRVPEGLSTQLSQTQASVNTLSGQVEQLRTNSQNADALTTDITQLNERVANLQTQLNQMSTSAPSSAPTTPPPSAATNSPAPNAATSPSPTATP